MVSVDYYITATKTSISRQALSPLARFYPVAIGQLCNTASFLACSNLLFSNRNSDHEVAGEKSQTPCLERTALSMAGMGSIAEPMVLAANPKSLDLQRDSPDMELDFVRGLELNSTSQTIES